MKIAKKTPSEDIRGYANDMAQTLIKLMPEGGKVVFPLVGESYTLTCERTDSLYSVYHILAARPFPQVDISVWATSATVAQRALATDLFNWLAGSEQLPSPIIP